MNWNFDMADAPRGRLVWRSVTTKDGDRTFQAFERDQVILATKCGKVTASYWIPDEGRWCMLSKNEEPVAWMRWPDYPDNRHSLNSIPGRA